MDWVDEDNEPCYSCGSFAHWTEDCQDCPKPLPPVDPHCFCCGQIHTDKDCPIFWSDPEYWDEMWKSGYRATPCREDYHSYSNYELEEAPFSGNQKDYDYYENSQSCFSPGYYQDQYQIPPDEDKGAEMPYQSEEENNLARAETMLSKLEEFLSTPNLSIQQRIEYLTLKCEVLSARIDIAESMSPLPDDIRDYSQAKDEVVETNTTPNPLLVEELQVENVVVDDAGVTSLSQDSHNSHPALITLINKVRDDDSKTNIRNVRLQDIGQRLLRWFFHSNKKRPIHMPIFKHLFIWHVNYRAYIGNSVGKCALRPP